MNPQLHFLRFPEYSNKLTELINLRSGKDILIDYANETDYFDTQLFLFFK